MTTPNLAPAMRAAIQLASLEGIVHSLDPIVAGLRALKELVAAHEALAEKTEGADTSIAAQLGYEAAIPLALQAADVSRKFEEAYDRMRKECPDIGAATAQLAKFCEPPST